MSAIQFFDGCVAETSIYCTFEHNAHTKIQSTTIQYKVYCRNKQPITKPMIIIPVPHNGTSDITMLPVAAHPKPICRWKQVPEIHQHIPKTHDDISDDILARLTKYYDRKSWGCIILFPQCGGGIREYPPITYKHIISSKKMIFVPMRQWDLLASSEPPKQYKFNNTVTVKSKSNRQSRSFRGCSQNKDMLVPLVKKNKD